MQTKDLCTLQSIHSHREFGASKNKSRWHVVLFVFLFFLFFIFLSFQHMKKSHSGRSFLSPRDKLCSLFPINIPHFLPSFGKTKTVFFFFAIYCSLPKPNNDTKKHVAIIKFMPCQLGPSRSWHFFSGLTSSRDESRIVEPAGHKTTQPWSVS